MNVFRTVWVTLLVVVASATSQARVVYVDRAATGGANGGSWNDAYTTIQRGVDDAGEGDEVWVAAGTYHENVSLHNNVGLYGGFNGTEPDRDDRNPAINFTSIDGGGTGSCVWFDFGAGPQTVLDGFRLRNGRDNNGGGGGGGVFVSNLVTGTISNNVITENSGSQGTGIAAQFASVVIANNLIAHNTGGSALVAYSGTPRDPSRDQPIIVNNTVVDNHGSNGGSAVAVNLGGLFGAVFANNIVALNDLGVNVSGDSTVTISHNDVTDHPGGNWQGTDPTGSNGNISQDAFFADEGSDNYRIIPGSPAQNAGNNALAVGAVDLDSRMRIQNGAVDMGAYELGNGPYQLVFSTQPAGGAPGAHLAGQPVITVEDQSGNRVRGYSGTVTIAIDPGSGNPDAALSGTKTVTVSSGRATFTNLSVDLSGTGYVLNATTSGSAMPVQSRMFSVHGARMYVRSDGNDGDDGLSWGTAKQTVQAALDQNPEEVWVATGTYQENPVVNSEVSLYGGFHGNEQNLTERDPSARATLDGGANGTTLTSDAVNNSSHAGVLTLDGFVIQNGAASGNGGGAMLTGFHGTISNVEFSLNSAANSGGGLYLESKNNNQSVDIQIQNVTFRNNTAATGGGLYADSNDNWNLDHHIIHFSNTTFDTNAAGSGGGVYFTGRDLDFTHATAFTNNVATMGGGLYGQGTVNVNGGMFSGNGTTNATGDAAGGAVYIDGGWFGGYFVTFQNNAVIAPGFSAIGGAAATKNGSLYLFGDTFLSNQADRGGAVYASGGGTVWLTHATLRSNVARDSGGGAYLRGAGLYVESSLIAGNRAGTVNAAGYGGGLALDHAPLLQYATAPAQIMNATIADNIAPMGGGMDIRSHSIVRAWNNVVAFNSSGVRVEPTSAATFFNNVVSSNTPGGDYQTIASPTGTNGNISQDPLFVNRASGDYHIQPGSPAVDAGDSGHFSRNYQDLDYHPRVLGARVDMGAYEADGATPLFLEWEQQPAPGNGPGILSSQPRVRVVDANGAIQSGFNQNITISIRPNTGTTGASVSGASAAAVGGIATFANLAVDKGGTGYILTATASGAQPLDADAFNVVLPTVRVAVNGSDSNDGASWASPKRTLQAAVDGTAKGGSSWVAGGTYVGALQIHGTNLLGGFAGSETDPAQRTAAVTTILDADHLREALNVQSNEGFALTFDGLTIQNAVNNGVQAYPDNLTFSNSLFQNNTADFGAGILSFGANVRFSRDRFLSNTAKWGGGAMYLGGNNNLVEDSLLTGNATTYGGSAINIYAAQPLTLANNTIAGNTGPVAAVYLFGTPANITNNIVANNGAGIARDAGASSTVVLSHNDVFGNTAFNYQNMPAGATDISADPLFVNPAAGDYRLASGSPAVDAGDDSVLSFLTLDLAGNPRKSGAHVDLGALEQSGLNLYGMGDAVRALKICAGLTTATSADVTRLNVDGKPGITVGDAARLTRKVAGTEANP